MESLEVTSEVSCVMNSNTSGPSNNVDCVNISDSRINCTNSSSLDIILDIVKKNITEFSESLNLKSEKSQFIARAMEVFKNNIQDNVTVDGLPYAANKEGLSPVKKKVQEDEAVAALLAKLAKKVEDVAEKRKNSPKVFCRILQQRLQMEKHRIKTAKIEHSLLHPPVKKEHFQINSINPKRVKELQDNLKSAEIDLKQALEELKDIKQNVGYIKELYSKKANQEILQDTGYNSS